MKGLPKKEVDNGAYISALIDIINSGNQVPLPVSGHSMVPFLVDGRDTVVIAKPTEKLKKGDIALFKRDNGEYILHRIYKTDKNGDLFFVGDSETNIEGPIKRASVYAVAVRALHKGKWIKEGDFLWNFFSRVWIIPVKCRPLLFKAYNLLKRFKIRGRFLKKH